MTIRFYTDETQTHQHTCFNSSRLERFGRDILTLGAVWIVVEDAGVVRRFKVVEESTDTALNSTRGGEE